MNPKNKQVKIFLGLVVLLGLVYFLPLKVYTFHVLIMTLFYAFLGTAWNIMSGYGGQLSLGHAAFTGVGAYATLLLFRNYGLSPWLGLIVGAFASALIMALIAYPCFRFRVRGPYFTLSSIALAEIVRYLLNSAREITGGSLGLSLPYHSTSLALLQFDDNKHYYLVILVLWAASVGVVWGLEKLRYYLSAVREDEDAAAASGISVTRTLMISALISAVFVSLGGTFYMQYFRYIDPHATVGFYLSLNMALVSIVGGAATLFGPTIGALVLIPISEYLRLSLGGSLAGAHLVIYGLILILCIIYMPKGIVGLLERLGIQNKWRAKRHKNEACKMKVGV